METAAQYLYQIVLPLVEHKDEVKVDGTTDDRGVLLYLSLNKSDMGRIIGKKGETARAVRKIIRQYGMTTGAHVALKINEPA